MGISLETAVGLYKSIRQRGLSGTALILGKQDLVFGIDSLLIALAEAGCFVRVGDEVQMPLEQVAIVESFRQSGRIFGATPAQFAAGDRRISDEFFFTLAGFSSVYSVDYSDFEGAGIIHDLNRSGLSAKLPPCNFIYDGGTLEHVFHVPNVLQNIFETLAVGGYVLHHAPSNNLLDHGFYQFSPTLFWDFYHANGYEEIACSVFVNVRGVFYYRDYHPGELLKVSHGGLDESTYYTGCWARKGAATTGDRIPQQGVYTSLWDAGKIK